MAVIKNDGFTFVELVATGKKCLAVESARLADCLRYITDKNIEAVIVSRYHGYAGEDVEFLRGLPSVTHVFVQDHVENLSGVLARKDLQFLSTNKPNETFSLAGFDRLVSFSAEWNENICDVHCARVLRKLSLWGYKTATGTFGPSLWSATVEELDLIQCNLTTFTGIDNFPSLQVLEAERLPKLRDISALSSLASTLKVVRLKNCKNIVNHNAVTSLKHLQRLAFNGCGTLHSLTFLKELPALEEFAFVNTLVSDGDMRPLFGLRRVGFLDKKHYSHKYSEVAEKIAHKPGNLGSETDS